MCATVGALHAPDAWLRFARRVEQIDRAARWPLRLCMLGDVPCIVARHALGVVVERGAGAWLVGVAAAIVWANRGVSPPPRREISRRPEQVPWMQPDAVSARVCLSWTTTSRTVLPGWSTWVKVRPPSRVTHRSPP